VQRESRSPLFAVWLLRATAVLAPRALRDQWRSLWMSRLENLWILADRGELPIHAPTESARLCRDAIAAAFWMRFERARVMHWMRGPGFVLCTAAAALVILAVLSNAFAGTRNVIYTYIAWKTEPRALRYDPKAELVVSHFVPLLFALTMGAALIAIGRLSLGRYGWRYWIYLAGKLAAVLTIVPLIWIEGNAALRAHVTTPSVSLLLGWTAWTLAFLGAFGCGVMWVFTDQRQRCPVCLGRLAMPVTLGSWASVFEPATTELLCDEGHGALSMDDGPVGAGDRWTTLDSSWRGL
jgi:hypothetical protein